MTEPIIIEQCSSANSTFIKGEPEKVFLENDYIQLVGGGIFEEKINDDDEDFMPKRRITYDYDLTMVKSSIVNIEMAYSNSKEIYVVQIKAGAESCHMTIHFSEKEKAANLHAKIMAWMFERK